MNTPMSLPKILDSLETLSEEDKNRLLDKLQEKRSDKETQEDKIIDEENPWIKLAGKYQNDPQYDEVLQYIEQYRGEIDAQNEPSKTQTDREIKQVS